VSEATTAKIDHRCQYCEKTFQRESSLAVHVCEQKKRYQGRDEQGTRLGLQAYLRFYEVTQGSAKLKTFDDFARSPYYKAFVKFGRHCVAINAVNTPRFIDWVVEKNKKIDHWCRDAIYTEYLHDYLRRENVNDALVRAIEQSLRWSEQHGNPSHDFLRYGHSNVISYAITTGRISAWVLYNCESGQKFLDDLNQEQIAMVWPWIDPEFWQKKFRDYPADREYAREILTKGGW
jgi:hypothetical protein